MGVYDLSARGAGEYCEPTVLRGDQRDGITLVVNKLCSREVAGPAELGRLYHHRAPTIDRLRDDHLSDYGRTLAADNLGAKSQQLVIRIDQRRAIDGGQAGYFIYDAA